MPKLRNKNNGRFIVIIIEILFEKFIGKKLSNIKEIDIKTIEIKIE